MAGEWEALKARIQAGEVPSEDECWDAFHAKVEADIVRDGITVDEAMCTWLAGCWARRCAYSLFDADARRAARDGR